MNQEVKVPPMGESITEATVATWRVQAGQAVKSGDILVELETDKVTMEVPAPAGGVLKEIKRKSGETVKVDEVLGMIDTEATVSAAAVSTPTAPPGTATTAPQGASSGVGASTSSAAKNDTVPPGARRLAEENKVDTNQIQGTGVRGQVTKSDVVDHLARGIASANPTPTTGYAIPASPITPRSPGEREQVVPMTRIRQRIAQRLLEAQESAAILTTFNEVDMSPIMEMRSKYKEAFQKKYNAPLGFMSFFTKAVVDALKFVPAVNAEIRENNIVYKNYYDIGVAVGGPKGLVVPIVRDADKLSFNEVEMEIARLAGRVKDGSISLEEMQGGSFTISNGGIYGSMMSTPILNPPQSGILGMHNIVKRAVVVNDEIVIRPMMYLALSYDHRIVDGKEAVTFLVRVKECVEDPARILLSI